MKAYLDNYIEELLSLGRFSFTRNELEQRFDTGNGAIRQCLQRLVRNGAVKTIRNGFYVIVPPEYRSRGILPPEMFIDDFMHYLDRPYYVGLLSAAALHGAAHQQPQGFFVLTPKPAIRPVQRNGLKLLFTVKSAMPESGIEKKKSPAGNFSVSSPELTAIDLLVYLRQSGGLAATIPVLEELAELFEPEKLGQIAEGGSPSAALQRLGYILESVFGEKKMADTIHSALASRRLFHVPLNPNADRAGSPVDRRWKIHVNDELENER
ncbi:MAG: type IV toxin-antitoxin system AbiEi family antitoxin [Kiritimatiellales bacterium]|nr:type IV toxin-antitoxin system AbiEi family antitoxin [Kiritimatiellales bacterium]